MLLKYEIIGGIDERCLFYVIQRKLGKLFLEINNCKRNCGFNVVSKLMGICCKR